MSALTLLLILVALVTLVAGQLLLKWALSDDDGPDDAPPSKKSSSRRAVIIAGGIFAMTISFFVNLGLLQRNDLSLVFPFQGLSVIIVTVGASIFLKERLTLPLVVGALLITVGVMLVAAS